MGCFDEVVFTTPCCKEKVIDQSKSGECDFKTYSSEEVLMSVVYGLSEYVYCPSCGKKYKVTYKKKKIKVQLKEV